MILKSYCISVKWSDCDVFFFYLIQEWNEKAAEAKKEYEKAMEEYKAKKKEASDDEGDDDSSK